MVTGFGDKFSRYISADGEELVDDEELCELLDGDDEPLFCELVL
jgi:hypothetical protein